MKRRLYLLILLVVFLVPSGVNAKSYEPEHLNWGGNGNDYFEDVTATSDGGYVAVGYTYSTDLEGITVEKSWDAIIVKFDCDDNVEWQKNFAGSRFHDIITTSDGGYVVAGSLATSTNGLSPAGMGDALIVKYDKDGKVTWCRSYATTLYDYYYGVTETSDGGYVAGVTQVWMANQLGTTQSLSSITRVVVDYGQKNMVETSGTHLTI